jgi:hypothetical protein
MSVHRAVLFVLAALFTAGMTSAASAGCGGCGTPAPIVYAPPVATWTTCGCACGCRGLYGYGYAAAVEPTPIAPAPIYVVNQGPDYTGPGIMVPYHTWTPAVRAYPYRYGYGYGYHRPLYWHRYGYRYRYGVRRAYVGPHHVVYRGRVYARPLYRRPVAHPYYR